MAVLGGLVHPHPGLRWVAEYRTVWEVGEISLPVDRPRGHDHEEMLNDDIRDEGGQPTQSTTGLCGRTCSRSSSSRGCSEPM